MTETSNHRVTHLRSILAAIEDRLSAETSDDIASFIDAGEDGLAADTIFCAISEGDIPLDAETMTDLAVIADLYNLFGDLDPGIAKAVLDQQPQSFPTMP